MGTEPPLTAADTGLDTAEYCRQVETYLCGKNDGHLIRVVGPSFEIVSGWAQQGVPIKVAFRGIDRYFERYYAKGPRRRPVKIDFCAADVLDTFDEWRRALGLTQSSLDPARDGPEPVEGSSIGSHQSSADSHKSSGGSRQSLPAHLERVLLRLSNARARGMLSGSLQACE